MYMMQQSKFATHDVCSTDGLLCFMLYGQAATGSTLTAAGGSSIAESNGVIFYQPSFTANAINLGKCE
jgi:hypothetical protein